MYTSNRRRLMLILPWLLAFPLIAAVGVLTALSPLYAAAGVVGVCLVGSTLLISQSWLLVITLLFAALVGGSVEYFLGMAQANWLAFLLSLVLAVRAILFSQSSALKDVSRKGNFSYFLIPAYIYLAIVVGSTILNLNPIAQVLASIKNYLLMWGVLLVFALTPNLKTATTLVWKWVLFVAAVQLPVALYQKLFVASKLSNSASALSFDAINGTFGGGLLGGRSGALAMFICIAVAYALILWRDKRWSATQLFLYLAVTLPTLAIVEVKAVVFWLPLAVLAVFFSQIKQRPLLFIGAVIASLLAVTTILYVYQVSYGGSSVDSSPIDAFLNKISYVFDPDRFNPATRELGRASALTHWWRENGMADPLHFLLGYGPGASRGISTVAIGAAAAKYSFYLDISAASALLWDTGLLGLFTFISLIMWGAIQAKKQSQKPNTEIIFGNNSECASIALILILSSVFYTRDAVDGPIIQFFMFFCLGHVLIASQIKRS